MLRRALVVVIVVVPFAVVAACGKDEPAKTPIVAPVVAVDATVAPPPVAELDAGAAPVTGEGPLPSGDYEIVTEVVKDTCSSADAGVTAPPTVTMFVQMKVWRDKSGKEKITGNFPLPLPAKGGYGSARSDIVLQPPADPAPISLHGLGSQCPTYETKTSHRVISRSGDTVKVTYARDYGDASTCRSRAPSKCVLEYLYTFRLVKKLCDPNCGVTFAKGADGGLSPRCECSSSNDRN